MQEVEEGSSPGDDEDGRKGTTDVRTRRWFARRDLMVQIEGLQGSASLVAVSGRW
jgi:hypothetical protein